MSMIDLVVADGARRSIAIGVLGRPGCGKTWLVASIVRRWPYRGTIIDPEWSLRFADPAGWTYHDDHDPPWGWRPRDGGTRVVVIDEVEQVVLRGPEWRRWVSEVANVRRPNETSLIWTTRRPTEVPVILRATADYLAVGALSDPRDLAWCREAGVPDLVSELPPRRFVWIRR